MTFLQQTSLVTDGKNQVKGNFEFEKTTQFFFASRQFFLLQKQQLNQVFGELSCLLLSPHR